MAIRRSVGKSRTCASGAPESEGSTPSDSEVGGDGERTEAEIAKQVRRSHNMLKSIRLRIGFAWVALALLAGVFFDLSLEEFRVGRCLHAMSPGTQEALGEFFKHLSLQFMFELGFAGRFFLLGLAPLADAVCFTRCVLVIDMYVFVHTRAVTYCIRRFGRGEDWFTNLTLYAYYARGAVFVGIVLVASFRRSALTMQKAMWMAIGVYGVMNMVDKITRFASKFVVYDGYCYCISQVLADALIVYVVARPSLRHRAQRSLDAWLQARASTRAAACIACLLAERPSAEVVAQARARFRCMSLADMDFDSFKDNRPNPKLYALSASTSLGHCDAFVSHSWHDDPEAKWVAIQEWRESFKSRYGREPNIWFDKVCIDQSNIDGDLACLPIFLSGCQRLVILCGSTYLSRLWCVLELFVYVQMGGSVGVIEFVPVLRSDKDGGYEDLLSISQTFQDFDAADCHCRKEQDKQNILIVISTAFYGVEEFNRLVREMVINIGLRRETSSLISDLSSDISASSQGFSQEGSSSTSVVATVSHICRNFDQHVDHARTR